MATALGVQLAGKSGALMVMSPKIFWICLSNLRLILIAIVALGEKGMQDRSNVGSQIYLLLGPVTE